MTPFDTISATFFETYWRTSEKVSLGMQPFVIPRY